MKLLRFMDWMATNDSTLSKAEDRPKPADYTWARAGVPMEILIALANELDPDLIILDLNMQGMDGHQTLKQLRDDGVTSRIVMLTVSDSNEDVIKAISLGADGYLLKDSDPDELLEQIKKAVQGKMVLSEAVNAALAEAIRRPVEKPATDLSQLTHREQEILELIAKGRSNKLIARELNIRVVDSICVSSYDHDQHRELRILKNAEIVDSPKLLIVDELRRVRRG